MAWTTLDFGSPVPGEVIGTIPASGVEPITKKLTVFTVACVGQLPSPHGQPIGLLVMNRSDGLVTVMPGSRDVIEVAEPDEPLILHPGEDAAFYLPVEGMPGPPPRQWWVSITRVPALTPIAPVVAMRKGKAA